MLQSIFLIATAPKGNTTKSAAAHFGWAAVGVVIAVLPMAFSYFYARVLFSMCSATIGKGRKGN